ncbi:MAG: site-specific integrase [Prevotellaceae bacterium]|jgi:integrase|nr:site-specific integrase [Prevotellaceae bacterium]
MLKHSQGGVTLSLFFDQRRQTNDGKYPIKLSVCHQRKRKYIATGIYITKAEWDILFTTKKRELIATRNTVENAYLKLKHHIEILAAKGIFSFDALSSLYHGATEKTVSEAFASKIKLLKENDQIATAGMYECALNSLSSLFGSQINYKDITVGWLKSYEKNMLKENRSYTTISMYLRCLRAIFKEAMAAGYVEESSYPFGAEKNNKYEIPSGTKRKLALSMSTLKQIFDYNDGSEATEKYVALWKFSYLCNGANMNDILRLKYSNIQGEELFFERGKTTRRTRNKREIVAYITPEMREIVAKWGNKNTSPNSYIFPYIAEKSTEQQKKTIIADVIKRINKRMKKIADELGIPKITTYTARHSYATVLKRSGANIAFISESLGHSDIKTTEDYLASFETEERKKNAQQLTNFLKK